MTATLLAVAISALGPKPEPAWFDTLIAGYLFAYDQSHTNLTVRDPASGYFLSRDVECDGGILVLTLGRNEPGFGDYRVSPPEGSETEVKVKRLPTLATGKGLRIGDSEDHVASVLGKPTKRTREEPGLRVLHYSWKEGRGDESWDNEQSYIFRAGKLIAVQFSRELAQ